MQQIIEIVGELEIRIRDAAGIGSTNLGPSAEPRSHPMAFAVMEDALLKGTF